MAIYVGLLLKNPPALTYCRNTGFSVRLAFVSRAFKDTDLARRAGWRASGYRKHWLAVKHWGIAACRPGSIPGWWHILKIKPDPKILFGAESWPDDVDWQFHVERQSLIHGRYRNSPWYPAFARGITWYELCRERENMTAPDRDLKRKTFSSDDR